MRDLPGDRAAPPQAMGYNPGDSDEYRRISSRAATSSEPAHQASAQGITVDSESFSVAAEARPAPGSGPEPGIGACRSAIHPVEHGRADADRPVVAAAGGAESTQPDLERVSIRQSSAVGELAHNA